MSGGHERRVSCRSAALAYLARGWSVIPIERGGKHPLIPWLEFQGRSAAVPEIERWFARWRDANIGIVTGVVSRLIVVDADERHGGLRSLAALEAEHGTLPHTITAATGGGGRHFYFAHQGGVVHNRVGLAPGIDVRGDGGYVVAPPSLHPSGRRYAWLPGCAPGEAPLAAPPGWLARQLRRDRGRAGHPLAHWRELVRRRVPAGERNNTIASLAGHLLWHGVDAEVALELLSAWNEAHCEPPLSPEEVKQVVDSIVRVRERRAEEEPD